MSIVLESLVKRYGGAPIVDGVSLEVQKGELFVLLGASGTGKSTVLRLIAGLIPLDSGRIVLEGRDVTHLPPQKRGTGFVFQNYSIFRHMTVAQNIELGLKIRKVSAPERARRRDELLDLVGLAGLGDRHADQLSGGQQQRVALARALAYEPSVLLLDEPFGALDVKIRVQLRRTLKDLRSRLGVTTILVTHDQEEAFDLADRIAIIERGGLLEVGSPEELYTHPKTLFTATFLGAGNVLVGRAKQGTVHFGPVSLPLPVGSLRPDGATVQVLMRPEQIVVWPDAPPAGASPLGEGTVIERSFTGINRRFRARLPRLPHTRQIQPVVPFGDDATLIDFVMPADVALDSDRVWLGLREYHVIDEELPQILVLDEPLTAAAPLGVARKPPQNMRGQITLLSVADAPAQAESVRVAARDRARAAGLESLEPKVRFGDSLDQLQIEQGEQVYDFTVVAGSDREGGNPSRLSRRVVELLDHLRNPLIIVKGSRTAVRKILICTAAGEPGKADVSSAGRIARRLGASAALVHVRPPGSAVPERARAHLQRAERALQALDVPVSVRMIEAPSPTRGILDEAKSGDYDLIVVGQHQASSRLLMRPENVSLQVCAAADRSVLVLQDELE